MTTNPTRIEALVEACEASIATYLGDDAESIDAYNRTFADLAKALDPHCADEGPDEKLVTAFRLGQQSREPIVAAAREVG